MHPRKPRRGWRVQRAQSSRRHGHIRTGLLVLTSAILISACADRTLEIDEQRIPIAVGSSTIDVVVHRSEESGLTFLNLHDDENTAVEAARFALEHFGGRLIELQHTGERNVRFSLGDTSYAFDPNRIFTANGIDSTLARHGSSSGAAADVVATFADTVVSILELESLSTVATVHNNSDERYSARSYTDDGPYASDARFVHIAAGSDADDFFFVTTQELYDDLRAAGFNVVMQDNALVTDDGSLSVLCGKLDIPYVNAEAQQGHLEEQQKMLAYLHELLATE